MTNRSSSLTARYAWRFRREMLGVAVISCVSSVLALLAPAIVAVGLATFNVGSQPDAAGGGVFDLNLLGPRVLELWPFRLIRDRWTMLLVVAALYVAQASAVAAVNYRVFAFAAKAPASSSPT
jgi:hypothetical protein